MPQICLWSWKWKSQEQPWITDLAGLPNRLWISLCDGRLVTRSSEFSPVYVYICKNTHIHKWQHHPSGFSSDVQLNEECKRDKSMQQNSPLSLESSGLNQASAGRILWICVRGPECEKTCRMCWEKTHTCVFQSHSFWFSNSLLSLWYI